MGQGKIICLLIIITSYNYAFGQASINTTGPVHNLTDALNLKLDKLDNTLKSVYLEFEVTNTNHKQIIYLQTPVFDLNENIQYINITQLNQVNFIIGDYETLSHPEPGRYNLKTTLYDNTNRIKLSYIENIVIVDTSISNQILGKLKKVQFNMEVRNTSNFSVIDNSLTENPNFTRLEINPRLSIMDVPLIGNVTFEKNWLYDTKFHLENYSIGFDYESIKKKAYDLATKRIQDILRKNNADSIAALRNLGYSDIANQVENWDQLLKLYNTDSIKKIMHKVTAYSSLDSIIANNKYQEKIINASDSITYYQEILSNPSFDTSSAYYKNAQKLHSYYTTLHKNIDQLLQGKQKIDKVKEKYATLFKNKNVLDDLSKIDPLKYFDQKTFLEKFINSKFFDNKTIKALYGIKKFQIGSSILTGSNQSLNGTLINGINFSYKYKKVYTHIFAGIKSDRLYFNRGKLRSKDKSAGITIGMGQEGYKNIEGYYNYFETSRTSDSLLKDISHLFGVAGSYIIKKEILFRGENSYVLNNAVSTLGYLFKGSILYQHKDITLTQEILYKSNDYNTNNIASYSPENILVTTGLGYKFLKNMLSVKLNNTFAKRIKEDSTTFKFSNLSTISINYRSKEIPFNLIVNVNYFLSKYTISPSLNNIIQATLSGNYTITKDKYLHSLNLTYSNIFSRAYSSYISNSDVIIVRSVSPNIFSQHQISLSQAIDFMKSHTIINRTAYNILSMSRDSSRTSIGSEFTYIKTGIKYFKPQITFGYNYNKISNQVYHSQIITFNPVFTFKNYVYVNLLISYTHNKLINNIVKPHDLRFQTSVILRY